MGTKTYKLRKRKGLCVKCGVLRNNTKSTVFCKKCQEVSKKQKKKLRNYRSENQLCTWCGFPRDREGHLCKKCTETGKQYYESKKKKKICVVCSIPLKKGTICFRCYKKSAERHRNKRERYKILGKCIDCGKNNNNNIIRCSTCSTKHKKANNKYRKIVIKHYGNKCDCCGEKNKRFLTIDHINNDGSIHRKELSSASVLYKWIIDEDFPENLRVLCYNCNCGRQFSLKFGICPHHIKNHSDLLVKKYTWRNKKKVIDHYGGRCECCDETNIQFLTMDHINGGGRKHRKDENICNIYRWLINNSCPDGFQVLCYNCNCGRAYTIENICPHKIKQKVEI